MFPSPHLTDHDWAIHQSSQSSWEIPRILTSINILHSFPDVPRKKWCHLVFVRPVSLEKRTARVKSVSTAWCVLLSFSEVPEYKGHNLILYRNLWCFWEVSTAIHLYTLGKTLFPVIVVAPGSWHVGINLAPNTGRWGTTMDNPTCIQHTPSPSQP